MDAAFTPSDGYVVGSSEDGRILFWELVSGEQVAAVEAHAGAPVTSLAVHPQDPVLLTSSTDGSIKVWS